MKCLLFDCHNQAHRNWHAMNGISDLYRKTAAMFGVLRDIHKFQDIHEAERVAFAFDSNDSHRKKLYPQYKADHTSEGKSELYRQIRILRTEILPRIGFKNVFCFKGYEADDIIGSICRWHDSNDTPSLPNDYEFIIVSSDCDLYQLLRPKVSIWNPAIKRLLTYDWLKHEYGIQPFHWPLVKAIVGGKDNIPGVKGVGIKTAIRDLLEQPINKATKDRISGFVFGEQYQINVKLSTLPWDNLVIDRLKPEKLSRASWDALMDKHNMRSLIGKYPAGAL